MAIIFKLDKVLAERGMSLNELSSKVGITNVNMSNIKTNKVSAIRFSTLNGICRVLDCQPGDILVYVKDPEKVENAIVVEDDMPSTSSINDKKPSNLDSRNRVTA